MKGWSGRLTGWKDCLIMFVVKVILGVMVDGSALVITNNYEVFSYNV